MTTARSPAREGDRLAPPSPPRSPWQRFYGAVHRARRAWYRDRAQGLPRPVISVGNLHWGGGGKTPLTAALAAHLRDRGHRVAILSRGYGSQGSSPAARIVSTGDGPLLGPDQAGDEPVLLAGALPGVAVVVCPDRHRAGLAALARLEPAPELFLLDDGFSHLRLARDLDLLAFPAADPYGGGRLAPSGRLREPLAAAARASAALLTGRAAAEDARRLAEGLRPFGFTGPAFAAPAETAPARRVESREDGRGGEELPAGTRVLLVSGVARPETFAAAVRDLAARDRDLRVVDELRYRDHHPYPAASLDEIARRAQASGAEAVLVTAKDRVKLQGRLVLPAGIALAELPLESRPEPAFWTWLDTRLAEICAARQPPSLGLSTVETSP